MELSDLNLRNPIKVGYYNPFDIYLTIKDDFESKFPLTNLHWKYHPLKPLKSIPLLPVKLIEEVPKSVAHEVDNDSVYIRLMFIKVESIDTYRSQVRPLIKAWMNKLVENSGLEWAIILFIPSSGKDKTSSIIKTSAFDKLKMDFGVDGKELPSSLNDEDSDSENEHCFKLKESYENDIQKLEAYNDITGKLKSLLLKSFNRQYQTYNDEIIQHDIKKGSIDLDIPKFNMKLKLANLLNDMRLLQESFDIYNELTTDLTHLQSKFPEKFDNALITIPKDFTNYVFESSFDLKNLKNKLFNYQSNSVNILEIKILLFINKSILLQSLSNFATSISISSLFISNLFQNVIYFLNDLNSMFPNQNLEEWSYIIVDNYLNLPICDKLIEINNKNNSESTQTYNLNEIYEFKGELRLLQRNLLSKLAEKKHFSFTEILQDISLDDKGKKPELELSFEPLISILESETKYYDYFEKLTEAIIQDFVAAERSKSIDILSIDLAILNYKRGNYAEALNILQDSYEFFIQNGWNFMGGILLEIYLECIEKIQNTAASLILTTCLKLFSNLTNKDNNKVGINNYGRTKKQTQVKSLFEKIVNYSTKLDHTYKFPIKHLFDVKILPFIKPAKQKTDKNYVEVEIDNFFGIDFHFDSIELVLSSKSSEEDPVNSANQLLFKSNNLSLSQNLKNLLKVHTTDFQIGVFKLSNLIIKVNDKLHLVQNISELEIQDDEVSVENNTTVIRHSKNSILTDSIVGGPHHASDDDTLVPYQEFIMYQNLKKFRCEFLNPLQIRLGKSSVALKLLNGEAAVENIKATISPISTGLSIDGKLNENFTLDSLKANETHIFDIPYIYLGEDQIIEFLAKVIYTVNGEEFQHIIKEKIDKTLTISVSVQDIFKSDFVFSKFQVGTSNAKLPIRILSNDLKTLNENYKIEKPPSVPNGRSHVTFGEQPASFFYKIIPNTNYTIDVSDTLDLSVNYSNLQDECLAIMEHFMLNYFEENDILDYWFLFKGQIFKHLKFDLNRYAIFGTVVLTNYYEVGLLAEKLTNQHIDVLKVKNLLTGFFQSLFCETNELSKSVIPSSEFLQRELLISVPIPVLSILQIVDLEFERKPQYVVGEPILVKLKVESTSRWSTQSPLRDDVEASASEDTQDLSILAESSPHKVSPDKSLIKASKAEKDSFQITIQNDENWLISGLKKQSFDIDPSKIVNENYFELILIPLNVGKLLLPRISIKSMNLNSKNDISMDFSVKNGLDTLLVVPELDSITFSF